MDIKLKKFKIEILIAFILFAFVIIVSLTYVSIFLFNKTLTDEFQEKVKLSATRLINIYKEKEDTIKNSTLALAKSDFFTNKFNVNPDIVASIFKAFLSSNKNFLEISYVKNSKVITSCKRIENRVLCDIKNKEVLQISQLKEPIFTKESFLNNEIMFETFASIKDREFIYLKSILKEIFKPNDLYNLIVIDKTGKIYYSDFFKFRNIYDLFNYRLVELIKKNNNKFVTNDIYVTPLNRKFKLIFIQNKTLLNKTHIISKRLAIIMLLISIFFAIPLAIFFSRPFYNFYKELDKRVKEEVEKTKEKEQLLMHQSKLASLGEMLGNIAHQWRQPLTRLSLIIQNLEIAFNNNKIDKTYLDNFQKKALAQIDYMSETIDDFINFFRKDTKKEKFYPSKIISKALELMEGRIKQNRVEVFLDVKNEKIINGYRSEFSQVILNIINNAIDVLKERGIKNRKIWIRVDGGVIEIEDNGGGVDESIKHKIFEPYFTTKFQSQGTGIGLYMSKIIITQHFKGELFVKNSENGAVFIIKLN